MENRPDSCLCRSTTGLFLAKKQASFCLAVGLICLLLSFLAGYFWGRRQPVADLSKELSSALLDKTTQLNSLNNSAVTSASNDLVELNANSGTSVVQEQEISSALKADKQYYGTLLGFSSLKAAQKYLNKLQNLGYNLQIKTRHSRNSKNKLYTWYQIITEKFTDKTKLEQLMRELKQQENLQSTKILEC